jgi:hypothetical protein
MPPAGLEPAALCLASSIRLSLTARQSWGCWLDYILDVSVPTRIVSEDPSAKSRAGFLRITQSSRLVTWTRRSKYRRLSGRPRIQGRPLNGFRPHFPIKAPTRQMLYPLSYRGTFKFQHVSTSKTYVKPGCQTAAAREKSWDCRLQKRVTGTLRMYCRPLK